MTITHRPKPTDHGTHCTCGVFTGSDYLSWHDHRTDAQLLHPDHEFIASPETAWDRVRTTFEAFKSALGRINGRTQQDMILVPTATQNPVTRMTYS